MLKKIVFLAGGLGTFTTPAILNLCMMGAQQVSYLVVFFLLRDFSGGGQTAAAQGITGGTALWLLLLGVLAVVYFACNLAFARVSVTRAYALVAALRLRLCDHMRRLSLAFFRTRDAGEITGVLIDDMKTFEAAFGMYLYDLVTCLAFPLLFSVLLLFFSWQLTLVLMVSALCALPLMAAACRVTASQGQGYATARDRAYSSLMEYAGGMRELKAADMKGLNFAPLRENWKEYQRLSIKIEGEFGFLALAYSTVLDIGYVLTLLAGLWLAEQGMMGTGTFIFFLIAGCRFIEPMQQLGIILPELRYSISAVDRCAEVLTQKPLAVVEGQRRQGHAVTFENVAFAYGAKEVLKDVSFTLPERHVTALVGLSGSGKSTLANLLLRFWDVDRGAIRIGGADIRSLPQEELYSLFSVVFQDVYLFDDTIFNNIRMARPEATDEEVMEAARKACCAEIVEKLENGWQSFVGEGGARLSGGEKQRISIARAILKNAPVVILDEATASLDPENELQIQQGLNSLLEGKTLLVIAHRLATVRSADTILVLDEGRIAERGTHGTLLEANALYARLWKHQDTMKAWQIAPA